MSERVPIILASGEGDRQSFRGGGLHTWKLRAADTGGAYFLFEDTMVRGKTTPLHCHPEADELAFVLDGEILVNVGGKETRVSAGGMSFVPRGVPHALLVVSEVARLLCVHSPGGSSEAFYRGASEPATSDAADTVDLARLRASATENPRGIELLGPPPFAKLGD